MGLQRIFGAPEPHGNRIVDLVVGLLRDMFEPKGIEQVANKRRGIPARKGQRSAAEDAQGQMLVGSFPEGAKQLLHI